MTTTRNTAPRFEDVYPRAPFSELIRLALKAAEASVSLFGRHAPRRPATMRPVAER